MTVAVLLATLNSELYFEELAGSILGGSHADIRLYIRDDLSSDRTRELAAGLAARDSRVIIVPNDRPSGSAGANFLNLLLAAQNERYLMFADADDLWLPDKVELTLGRMLEVEARTGAECPVLVHTDLAVADERLKVLDGSLFKYEGLSPRRKSLRELLAQNNITGCTVMVNRALADTVKALPESFVMHDWWLGLAAAAFGEISVIERATILYRQHGGNQVGAYRAGSLRAALGRFGDRKRARAIYDAMFAQAGCFADTYSDRLSPEQEQLCRAYASMAQIGRLGKIACIIKNGFYKNTLARNIGQFLLI